MAAHVRDQDKEHRLLAGEVVALEEPPADDVVDDRDGHGAGREVGEEIVDRERNRAQIGPLGLRFFTDEW